MSTLTPPNSILALWLPERASTVAPDVDWIFHFLIGLTLFFLVLVVSLMLLFVWRFRHRPNQPPAPASPPAHAKHTALEITWTVIPSIIVVVIFYFGFTAYMRMAISPPNAYEILVTARMWNWQFTYPNGYISHELHVPINTPVRLVLTSADVIHGFYVPAFRVKKDAVPGRYNKLWFQATKPGTFIIECTQYCGTSHSQMLSNVIVHHPADFRAWLENASNLSATMPPIDAGRMIYQTRGCIQCHSIDGSRLIGPSLKNLFAYELTYTDGSKSVVDENILREAIFNPQARIVQGYDPLMPSFKGSLTDRDIGALIAYIKSLSDKAPAPPPTTQPARKN